MGGLSARRKGHIFEREMVKKLKEVGFNCSTTRYSSRELDDACVDIFFHDNTPFNIQCKAYKNAPNLHTELSKMPKNSKYNIVAHKRPRRGTVVAMSLDDFLGMMEVLRSEKII